MAVNCDLLVREEIVVYFETGAIQINLFFLLLFNSKLHRRLHVITPSLWRLMSYLFLS